MASKPVDLREFPKLKVNQLKVPEFFEEDIEYIMAPYGLVRDRVLRMTEDLNADYSGKEPMVLIVADGANKFYHDLIYRSDLKFAHDPRNVLISRYGKSGSRSNEKPKIMMKDPEDMKGRDLIVIEDVIDEGATLGGFISFIEQFSPNSMKIAVLLDKKEKRLPEYKSIKYGYGGFIIPDEFVVGYGLDFKNKYRDLKHIGVLKPELYENSI